MKWSVLLVICILSSAIVSAASAPNVFITLKDIKTNEDISGVMISLTTADDVVSHFVPEGEIVRTNLANGTYNTVIHVDDLATPGKDFMGSKELVVDRSLVDGVFLIRTGTIRGLVKDPLDNIVRNAELKFDCSSSLIDKAEHRADAFGSYSVEYAPVGHCRVFAYSKRWVGYTDVQIEHGALVNADIVLDQQVQQEDYTGWGSIIAVIFILAVAFAWWKRKSKPKKVPKAENKPKATFNKRQNDVLGTLSDREISIVKALAEAGKTVTGTTIRVKTGLPKASLSRHLRALEAKNIIHITKVGKMQKIKLSNWFLGVEH